MTSCPHVRLLCNEALAEPPERRCRLQRRRQPPVSDAVLLGPQQAADANAEHLGGFLVPTRRASPASARPKQALLTPSVPSLQAVTGRCWAMCARRISSPRSRFRSSLSSGYVLVGCESCWGGECGGGRPCFVALKPGFRVHCTDPSLQCWNLSRSIQIRQICE
jgi:hypothetical protein